MSDIDEIKTCCVPCNTIRPRAYIKKLYNEYELSQGKLFSISTPYCIDNPKCVKKAEQHHQEIKERLN